MSLYVEHLIILLSVESQRLLPAVDYAGGRGGEAKMNNKVVNERQTVCVVKKEMERQMRASFRFDQEI